jgi:hypothetical protein
MPGLDPAGKRVNLSELMLEVGRVEEGSKVESCQGGTMLDLFRLKKRLLAYDCRRASIPPIMFAMEVSILVTDSRTPMHSAYHVYRRGQGSPDDGSTFSSRCKHDNHSETHILCRFRAYSKKKCLTFRAICNAAVISNEAPTL